MGSDRARVTFDPTRTWRGVVAQQGRVSLEADWNEAEAIAAEARRQVTLDVVGTVGTPDGGYAVTPVAGTSGGDAAGQDLAIGAGTLYLGGERLSLPDAITYGDQPDWADTATDPTWVAPSAIPATTTDELVYLTATEVEVSAVEDPALADVAIGGPDTAQRRRVLQRVRRLAVTDDRCSGAWAQLQKQWGPDGYTFDPGTMAVGSTARLAVAFSTDPGAPTPCQPVATGGYLGAENQLYRVEIVSVDASGVPTIAWGPDDASFLYRVTARQDGGGATTCTLASSPVDSHHHPQRGQAVQLLASAVVLAPAVGPVPASYVASPTGVVTTVAEAYDPGTRQLVLDQPATGPVPSGYFGAAGTPQLFLRVWQGAGVATPGQPFALTDAANGVDTGVTVTLTSSAGFHAGDFWQFALRPIAPAQIYPARYLDGPQPPDGPATWAAPLATVGWAGPAPTVTSCVPGFGDLVTLSEDAGGCCTIDVGPRDVDGGAGLAALVARYSGHRAVTICLAPGHYTLPGPLVIGPGNQGLTLRACQGGVTLAGPPSPVPPEFRLGLVHIDGATGVSLEGIHFEAPAATVKVPTTAVSLLGTADDTLVQAFAGEVAVSAAVVAAGVSGLAVTDCAFTLATTAGNTFGVGLLTTGTVDGCRVAGCTFANPSPPSGAPFNEIILGFAAEPPYQATFGWLHVPSPAATPRTATVGRDVAAAAVAQAAATATAATAAATGRRLLARRRGAPAADVATTAPAAGTQAAGAQAAGTQAAGAQAAGALPTPEQLAPRALAATLDGAVVESCTFDGVSVAALLLGHLGTARLLGNVVRNSYGGIWLFTSEAASIGAELSKLAPSGTEPSPVRAALDPLIKLAYAMGMLLELATPPAPSTSTGVMGPALLLRQSASLIARGVTAPAAQTAVPAGGPTAAMPPGATAAAVRPPAGAVAGTPPGTVVGTIPGLGIAPLAPEPSATTAVGTDLVLRLDFSHNQVDAVLADTYSGAGLVVLDLSSVPGSATVCGNRVRTRFLGGQAVLLERVAQAAVNDNLVANEADPSAPTSPVAGKGAGNQRWTSYSLVAGIRTILGGPAVAITGNVLVGSVRLPARSDLGLPPAGPTVDASLLAALSSWELLNTVIAPYATPTTASGI